MSEEKLRVGWNMVMWVIGIVFLAGASMATLRVESRISVLEERYTQISGKLDTILRKLP